MNRIINASATPKSNEFLVSSQSNSEEINNKALWEYFVPPKWKKGPEYRFLVYFWNKFKAYEKRKCLGKNFKYLAARIKYAIYNLRVTLKSHRNLILYSMSTDSPISRLLSYYRILIKVEFRLFIDAKFREKVFILYAYQKQSEKIQRQSRLALERLRECQNLVDDIYETEHPIKFFIWKNYMRLIRFLSEETSLKLTLFLSAAIIARVSIEQFIIHKYECKLAYAENKLPQLKYFGLAGQKLKNLIGANINEIQIEVNNTILTDLYNVPVSKQIYIQMPELYYSRKQLINARIVINTLQYNRRCPFNKLNHILVNTN